MLYDFALFTRVSDLHLPIYGFTREVELSLKLLRRRLTNRLGHQTTCARPFCLALNGMALLVTLCPDPSPHVRFYPPATRPTQH